MRKLIMILAMAMVAFGSFAKDFRYEADGNEWEYCDVERKLYGYAKWLNVSTHIYIHDVSEEDAWKIIRGEEFPTFEFYRDERKLYDGEEVIVIRRMPCRDYRNVRESVLIK